MNKGKYFSVYLREEDEGLLEALDRIAKRTSRTRNQVIVRLLKNCAWLVGELDE